MSDIKWVRVFKVKSKFKHSNKYLFVIYILSKYISINFREKNLKSILVIYKKVVYI